MKKDILNEINNRFGVIFFVILLIPTILSYFSIEKTEGFVQYYFIVGLYMSAYLLFELLKEKLHENTLSIIKWLLWFAFIPYIFFVFTLSLYSHNNWETINGSFYSILLILTKTSVAIPILIIILSFWDFILPSIINDSRIIFKSLRKKLSKK